MSLSADQMADRARLKKDVKRWRMLALLFLVGGLIFALREQSPLQAPGANYIARVEITGFIGDDLKREEMFEKIAKDNAAKAVVIRFDSPGGTALGGEELYRTIKDLSEKKPVVAVMRTACTSACYMASLGTSHMKARDSSITGSVGVILEKAEVTELSKNLGIEPSNDRTGELKAAPSPFKKFTESERTYIQGVVDNSFSFFLDLVVNRRKLTPEAITLVKDGRIFTGKQAINLGLIDAIGGEKEAVAWLEKEKKIPQNLKFKDVKPEKEKSGLFGALEQSARRLIFGSNTQTLDGLISIWQPVVR